MAASSQLVRFPNPSAPGSEHLVSPRRAPSSAAGLNAGERGGWKQTNLGGQGRFSGNLRAPRHGQNAASWMLDLQPRGCSMRRVHVPGALAKDDAGEGKSSETAQISTAEAVIKFKAAFSSLSSDAFSTLPGDLKKELKDAGFALASGPILLELGEDLGSVVLDLGRGMEEGRAPLSIAAADSLAASLDKGAAPARSSERAVLGRRLKSCGRFLAALGSSAPKEIIQLGAAFVGLGEELGRGGEEKVVDAAAVYGRRSLKIGSVEIEVSPSQAALGSFVAALSSLTAWLSTSALETATARDSSYASEGASLVASSLKQTLIFVGFGSAALSLVTCIGLAALALQLSSQSDD